MYLFTDISPRSAEKRIVLHSGTDVLHVISNLTGQLSSLEAQVEALEKQHSKQAAQIQELQSNLTSVKNDNSNQKSLIQALQINIANLQTRTSMGSTYVRWGRKSCPGNGTETVYSGFAAGAQWGHSGGAANRICLSPDPLWAHYTDAVDSRGQVYGAEYEFSSAKSHTYFSGDSRSFEDAPCSVCRTTRSSVVMIPGRNACYSGWTLEYKGYLVAGYYVDKSASEYVCLDGNPDVITGGQKNDVGADFYFVEGICGTLRCPPYENGRELTCAVCTK